MRRKGGQIVTRLTTIALLSALGFVLMAFARFPYPLAPWLMIEASEIVVIVGYALYGFTGGILVAIIKTLLDMAVNGITGVFGIGNITAFLTSLLFCLSLFLTSHIFHLFKKGFWHRIIAYVSIILLVATVMTLMNVFIITPIYLKGEFVTCFTPGVMDSVVSAFNSMGVSGNSYFWIVTVIYFPFNCMKAGICCAIYELIFNPLLFIFLQRSEVFKKYFYGSVFIKKEKEPSKIEDSPNQIQDQK